MINEIEEKIFNSNQPQSSFMGGLNEVAKYSFNKWLNIDEDLFITLEMMLRGYNIIPKLNPNGEIVDFIIDTKNAEPKMNEVGIRDVLQFVRMNMNKNVRMSNVSEKEVYRDVSNVGLTFNSIIAENVEKWELKEEFWDELITIVIYAIWFSYNRPKNEGERKQIGRTYSETKVAQSVETKNEKPPGLLSRVF